MLRHPVTKQTYERLDDQSVRVTDEATGSVGVFTARGRHVRGDLRYADEHFIQWVLDTERPLTETVSLAAGSQAPQARTTE